MYKLKTKIPELVLLLFLFILTTCTPKRGPISDHPIVVLTFDDAVKSHLTYVAPKLQEYGFDATFFVTFAWMEDSINFMNWADIKKLHDMGFEVGNHSWTHGDFSQPRNGIELEGELGLVEWMLKQNGIPKPISYAHTGNTYGPETIEALNKRGYLFARRGKQPEVDYGILNGGPGYDPENHHPLLIPTTIDFYPDMNMEAFKDALEAIQDYEIAVLQFHGVPDIAHPWVSTPVDQFTKYLDFLKINNYKVIAMRDLGGYIPEHLPHDPHLNNRYTRKKGDLDWSQEVTSSRMKLPYWINVMRRHHYTHDEMATVLGLPRDSIKSIKQNVLNNLSPETNKLEVLPFPGGRHPRKDFKEGMLSPMRGTKLSVFLPWDEKDFMVLDIPEAVSTQYGLTFLGHRHIPTVFDFQKITITNSDWKQDDHGNWVNVWQLPNNIEIGSKVSPKKDRILMKLWLTNHTSDTILRELKTQVCLMLGQTKDFASQTNENKILKCPLVAVESKSGDHWVISGWEGCSHPWGNEDCPCVHADPVFPNCAPGETVMIKGLLWFYSGTDVAFEMEKMKKEYSWL